MLQVLYSARWLSHSAHIRCASLPIILECGQGLQLAPLSSEKLNYSTYSLFVKRILKFNLFNF